MSSATAASTPTRAAAAPSPPDQPQRDKIVARLDTSMLVEASAGSGKTKSMVDRMVALLREGECTVDTLAAITFTRKAAAELRARFQVSLENAVRSADGQHRTRLSQAVEHIERCFIGTIHSFCGRLLRERPVEAGVDPAFEDLDDAADARLRDAAWQEYVAKLIAGGDAVLAELAELGVELAELAKPFKRFADFPDVHEWPAPEVELPDLGPAIEALRAYADHIRGLVPRLPDDAGNDQLMPRYRRVVRMVRQMDLARPAELMEIFAQFRRVDLVQRNWPGGRRQALAEQARWEHFCDQTAGPLVEVWLHKRYPVVLRVLRGAVDVYDRLRREAGVLNYQDLLMRAAGLLRDKPPVRRYFRRRFTHLLVDEFQDTDPVQAEVMMLLTADDPTETDWRRCRPVAGSLFVVGDPKQSIYRFRRADIVTYNEVRRIIEQCGEIVTLWSNFRSTRAVVEWVNQAFDEVFPPAATAYQPARQPMESARATAEEATGVEVLAVPDTCRVNDEVLAYESDFIARTVARALNPAGDDAERMRPSDFLVLARRRKNLGLYAQRLAELGIPTQVTGGALLSEVSELELLCLCLEAVVRPDNPVALVAVLRSELFGLSDTALYAFRQASGRFSFTVPMPEKLEAEVAERMGEALGRLRRYASWLKRLPPVVAVERIAADLGLPARAAAQQGGNVAAGSLYRALELMRSQQGEVRSAAELVDFLRAVVDGEEGHDGMPARPSEQPPLRVMNLHQAKGLEAPVVFLADPTGQTDHPVEVHVDRTGEKVRAYLSIIGAGRGRSRVVLACPAGWESLAEEEQRFGNAEDQRLHYVAATRAGRRLIVTQRGHRNGANPWAVFEEHLAGHRELAEPESVAAAPTPQTEVPATEPDEAVAAVTDRWNAALAPTYAKVAAKAISVTHAAPLPTSGEHGTEWGTVVHLLLEAAMARPEADLGQLARAALSEQGLDPGLDGAVLETVAAVSRSEIWRRAQASPQCLVEVPFEMLRDGDGPEGLPTLLRGVIDLAFREADGWVIVDYKSDAQPADKLQPLVDHYRGQVQTYGAAWRKMLGEPVRETGLYFTHADRYVVVADADMPGA